MFIPFGRSTNRRCDGMSRRHALRIGASGLLAGLSLPRLFQLEATAASDKPIKAKSCIFLFLEGGPSTIDMWDMKPDAPVEIRGPYKPISTNVPGTQIGEHLPRCAKVADRYTILRSHSHNDNGHTTGYHYTMTGYRADFADGTNSRKPNNVLYPSIGSVVARELGPRGSLPVYMNLPHPMTSGGAGFYGAEYAPFVIESDPVQPDFEVKDLRLVEGISDKRQERRQRLLDGLEKLEAKENAGKAGTMATYYERAHNLITSPAARKAFDIASEPDKLRDSYGWTTLGQSALLARRLVEAGCRFIGVDHSGWDTHFTCFPSLEKNLIPSVDHAFSALVTDLSQRGLLDSTLVVMMGEMGRTPRVNAQAGRDHWSMTQSVLFAGGGIKPGIVIGATDKNQNAPTSDPVSVEDILFTIFTLMGIDPTKSYYTPLGRPVPIVNGGKMVPGLV
jgi:hypothetical protein